jgi:hypothetical protein
VLAATSDSSESGLVKTGVWPFDGTVFKDRNFAASKQEFYCTATEL